MAEWKPIFIDGEPRNFTRERDSEIFVDHPDHPNVRCSQHRVSLHDEEYMDIGGAWLILGHHYSFRPGGPRQRT